MLPGNTGSHSDMFHIVLVVDCLTVCSISKLQYIVLGSKMAGELERIWKDVVIE